MRQALVLRIPWWLVPLLLLAFVLFCGLIADGFQVSGNTISDSDTLMRLAYLREVLADGAWHSGFFDRNNAPYGMVLHWTLPFNLLLAGLDQLLFWMPGDQALHYVGYWTGPLLRFPIALAGYWAARRAVSPAAAGFGGAMILFAPFVLNYADRGTANHHPLLYLDIVMVAGFAIAMTLHPERRGLAVAGGLAAAFSLWCSFELVVACGGFFALLFLLWARDGAPRLPQLLMAAAAFAGLTDCALLADPPYGPPGTIVFDHVSIALESLASLPLLAGLCLWPFQKGGAWKRFIIAAAAGGFWGLFYLWRYPAVLKGVQGSMDPYVVTEWLSEIGEVKPIQDWRKLTLYIGPCMLCVPLALVFVRGWWGKLAAMAALLSLCLAGQLHYRFAGYPAIASGLFLAWCLDRALEARWRGARVTAVAVAVLLAGFYYGEECAESIFGVSFEHPPSANDGNAGEDDNDSASCEPYDVRTALNDTKWLNTGTAAHIVAGDTNMTPALLYWTTMRTLAGNYHRDSQGIRDDYLFFRDPGDGTAMRIARARGIAFVLVCADGDNADYSYSTTATALAETGPGKTAVPQNTLYVRLAKGAPPPWLIQRDWPEGTHTDLLLYQVDKSRLE